MKTIFKGILLAAAFFTSCATVNSELVSCRLKYDSHTSKVKLRIPSNYVKHYLSIVTSMYSDNIHHYVYRDSSEIYINNSETLSFPNYYNIMRLNNKDSELRLQNEELIVAVNKSLAEKKRPLLPVAPDYYELSGTDANGLYWKDIKIGKISVGYLNVPEDQKQSFDNALSTLQIK